MKNLYQLNKKTANQKEVGKRFDTSQKIYIHGQ